MRCEYCKALSKLRDAYDRNYDAGCWATCQEVNFEMIQLQTNKQCTCTGGDR